MSMAIQSRFIANEPSPKVVRLKEISNEKTAKVFEKTKEDLSIPLKELVALSFSLHDQDEEVENQNN